MRRRGIVGAALLVCLPAACGGSGSAPSECTASALVTSCPGSEVSGIDISHYDGAIDWPAVKAHGIDFAFAKATEGTTFQDPTFATNWAGMKSSGVIRGAYQFFHPELDPTAQATFFLDFVKQSGGYAPGDIAPVADVETTGSQTPATIQANLKTFLQAVKAGTGMTPIIYVGESFAATNLGGAFGAYTLWIASWNQGASCPAIPGGWTTWGFWQTYDKGTVTGVPGMANVDLDVFNGTLGQLGGPPPAGDGGTATGDGGGARDGGGLPAGDSGVPGGGTDAGDGRPGAGGGNDAGGPPAPGPCG
jgi:lysozyme